MEADLRNGMKWGEKEKKGKNKSALGLCLLKICIIQTTKTLVYESCNCRELSSRGATLVQLALCWHGLVTLFPKLLALLRYRVGINHIL